MDCLIKLLKSIFYGFSCSTIITIPLYTILLCGRHKMKKKMTKEEWERKEHFKNWDIFEKYLYILIATGAILGSLYSPIAFFNAGNTQIGSLLEKRYYEEQYFVQFRSSSFEDPYMLIADIEKTRDEGYVINKVHFNNGGYITFSSMPVEPREEVHIRDNNNEWHYITLTKERVSE